jgi:predicted nucleic acid-binding protein
VRLLIDSSVWIDALSSKPTQAADLQRCLEEEVVVKIRPIEAEVLAGAVSEKCARKVLSGFAALDTVDPDWNSNDVWREMEEMAALARRSRLSPLGVVDRMILVAAVRTPCVLWTLDRALASLAGKCGARCL